MATLLRVARTSSASWSIPARYFHVDTKREERPAPPAARPVAAADSAPPMAFEDYIKLKKSLSVRGYVMGVPFTFLGMTASSLTFISMYPNLFEGKADEVQLIMGQDPMVVAGVAGMLSGFAGFLVGSSLIKRGWRMFNKEKARAMDAKEEDFLRRIAKYRAGGEKHADDYYGDKVKTLSAYRVWLRDQTKIRRQQEAFRKAQEAATATAAEKI
eukprot:m.21258 g.21258  ORF g.21258 m.21258 type:complete len:214 (-) comp10693_c0_seq1:37-678(-)